MDYKTTIERLSSRLRSQDLHHTLGRFRTVRQAYSFYQNRVQRSNPEYFKDRLQPRNVSLFPGVSPQQCAQELAEKGVSFGFQLPPSLVAEVRDFAEQAPMTEPGFEAPFRVSDVHDGWLGDSRPVMRGLVQQPSACPAVERVAQDPVLLEIVRHYLNYWPTQVTRNLVWTFPSPLPEAQQKEIYNPLSYHYDVGGYNFMSAYFYITDTDAQSGAHVMIERSHDRKPLHTLFSPRSGRQPDALVLEYYGPEHELIIEGPAGFGFVQDPSCFHKLLPPRHGKRLLLHIRYA
jgi:hypothetical protein